MPFARVGDTLILHGSRLSGGGLVVRIGRLSIPATRVAIGGDAIEVDVPRRGPRGRDADRPGRPPAAGDAHRRGRQRSCPELPRPSVSSGGLPFVLVPRVAAATVVGRTLTRDRDAAARWHCAGRDPRRRHDRRACGIRGRLDRHLGRGRRSPTRCRPSRRLHGFPARWRRSRRSRVSFDLSVQVGAEGPHVVTLTSTPASLPEAAAAIQAAIRGAIDVPGFDRVRVAATGRELILIAGDLTSADHGVGRAARRRAPALDGVERAGRLPVRRAPAVPCPEQRATPDPATDRRDDGSRRTPGRAVVAGGGGDRRSRRRSAEPAA